jgi:hypothetical protein
VDTNPVLSMTDSLFTILVAGGGAAVVCGGILLGLWKLTTDSLLERFRQSQAEELERLKTELGLGAARASRLETAQFGAFQEIWDTLADLRIAANRLWQDASRRNIDGFGHRLEQARRIIYGSQLVIDGGDLRRLRGIIHELEYFYQGKEGLLELRQAPTLDNAAVAERIEQNGQLRARFLDAVEELRVSLHAQMRGKPPHSAASNER